MGALLLKGWGTVGTVGTVVAAGSALWAEAAEGPLASIIMASASMCASGIHVQPMLPEPGPGAIIRYECHLSVNGPVLAAPPGRARERRTGVITAVTLPVRQAWRWWPNPEGSRYRHRN